MLFKLRIPFLALGLAAFWFGFLASPALAGVVPSLTSEQKTLDPAARGAEIAKIQRTLEMKIVKEKLLAYGLSAEEVSAKLAKMSDGQILMLAKASDQILAGGDSGIGVLIGVLVIIILIIVIIKLLDHHVIIR